MFESHYKGSRRSWRMRDVRLLWRKNSVIKTEIDMRVFDNIDFAIRCFHSFFY